ncbi:hypothetical protein AB6A40_006322 [Gnathostoma spinigerum]|uniref:Beta-1,4-mannosyltransferase n=1 Tax=Gnathostoma spinigerum TaxID=75299 RepID=A0ABD6EI26_9BILA
MVIRNKNAVLVVLGDIGRSPRMCYHAKSLAEKNYRVQIVGYVDTLPFPAISKNPNIRLVGLRHPPDRISSLPSALMLVLKCIWTFGVLLFALLFRVNWPLLILMQNPPGVPCMLACWMVARVKHAQFIIDWHNYTYSILRETYGVEDLRLERYTDRISGRIDDQSGTINSSNISDVRNRRMTKTERAALATVSATCKKKRVVERRKRITLIQRFIEFAYSWEGFFGRRSDLNICVTHSMRRDLSDSWGIKSATLYDRPPASIFHKLSVEETHTVFWELANQSEEFKVFAENDPKVLDAMDGDFTEVTKFSYRDGDGIAFLRDDRPLILMSSTSWTEDEDFGLLLNALQSFDKVAGLSGKSNPQTRLPHLICIITGRGPLKTYYMGRIEHLQMQNVQVITPWVDAEDYPRLLGSADIGVSLHTSTSGLDLPMKVVDMFGSGLPVLAKKFTCIGELVIDGQNGRLFDTSHELCDLIKSLTCGFPLHSSVSLLDAYHSSS